MRVSTYVSHGIDKFPPCCHGGVPEVAERVVTCLSQDSQGAGHSTENTDFKRVAPGGIHPVILRVLTPPALVSQKLSTVQDSTYSRG